MLYLTSGALQHHHAFQGPDADQLGKAAGVVRVALVHPDRQGCVSMAGVNADD
jgi:hypothetical protein